MLSRKFLSPTGRLPGMPNTKFVCWLNQPPRFVLLVTRMKLLSSLIGLVPILTCGATDHVPELPVETFFKNPELTQMRLSPDGKFVVAITHDHGKGLLFGINLETGARRAIITGEIYAFSWLTNERLLFWAGGVGLGGFVAIHPDCLK